MNVIDKLFPLKELPRKTFNKIRENRQLQMAAVPLGHQLNPRRWVFVVGCYNSGTTLLSNILCAHTEIGGLPVEGVNLSDSLPRPEEFGWTRMWSQCLERVRLEPEYDKDKLAERIKKQWSIWYPKDKSNLLEKSVANTARMVFLQEYFQPAYFIYIVRNGYSVAEGIRRKAEPKRWKNPLYDCSYPIELCAKQWRISDEIVEQDRANVERFLQIYYEDLTDNPEAVLKELTDFLGLHPFLSSELAGNWTVHNVKSNIENLNPRSFGNLTNDDIKKIENIAGNRLEKHGYLNPSKHRKI